MAHSCLPSSGHGSEPLSGYARIVGERPSPAFRMEIANRFWSRFRGLMLRRPPKDGAGLLLTRCARIHTAFMRFALDVAYLDRAGRVLAREQGLGPWRASAGPRGTAHTLEFEAGTLERLGIEVGSRIAHAALSERGPT